MIKFLKNLFKEPESKNFSKEVPQTQIRPPKDSHKQKENNPIFDIYDAVKDMDFKKVEKWMYLCVTSDLERELTENEKDMVNKILVVGMTYGISEYSNDIKKCLGGK